MRNGRQVFGRVLWTFGQSMPIVSIDGTFLTRKLEGTIMLICIGTGSEDKLVSLVIEIF